MTGRRIGSLSARLAMLAAALAAPVPTAADGGPGPDAGVADAGAPRTAGASITVVLRSRAGEPVRGASVFVEALAPDGERRQMEMKTDAKGEARVLGVPAGGFEHVVAGFRGGGGLLATSSPVELTDGADTRVELTVPEATEARGDLSIGMLHVVLERKGGRVEVTEVISLQSAPGTSYGGAPIHFPLPEGAAAPLVPTREGDPPAAAVEDGAFVVRGPIPAEGLDVELRFELPIDDARIAWEQRLGLPVRTLRVVSTWTADGAALQVSGLQPADVVQLASGLAALVAMGPGPEDGRLEVSLDGLRTGPAAAWRVAALVFCLLLLALGAGSRLRRRKTRGAGGQK